MSGLEIPDLLMGVDHAPWTLEEAREFLYDTAEPARLLGWGLSLCGSTLLDGFGRDLDIIAMPVASNAVKLWEIWDAESGWATLASIESRTGVQGRIYLDGHGRLLDVCFLPLRG